LLVANTLFDASIEAWDAKYGYDYVRPITVIRALGDIRITARPRSLPAVLASSSPEAARAAYGLVPVPVGIAEIPAADWEPYLPMPPFPAHVSGHSTFCAAWARVMELMTGSQEFSFHTTVHHLYVEQQELSPSIPLEHCQVARPTVHLQSGTDRPYMFWPQWWFLADELALVPGLTPRR
jgi:hypothetical protein